MAHCFLAHWARIRSLPNQHRTNRSRSLVPLLRYFAGNNSCNHIAQPRMADCGSMDKEARTEHGIEQFADTRQRFSPR